MLEMGGRAVPIRRSTTGRRRLTTGTGFDVGAPIIFSLAGFVRLAGQGIADPQND